MADQPLHLRSETELEAALRGLAGAIDWPVAGSQGSAAATGAAPDLAAVVRARIEAGEAAGLSHGAAPRWLEAWRSWRPARRIVVVAVAALLALAILAALAGAAGLGLPGLRISLGPPPVSPLPTTSAEPSRSATEPPGIGMRLGERVDLADLDARAGFPVRWPQDPAIGPPDAAYIDPLLGGQVTLVWASRPDLPDTFQPGVGLVMSAFPGTVDNGFLNKAVDSGTTVQLVKVNGDRAFWISGGPHFFFYTSAAGQVFDPRRWVGDALLWADGSTIYRLESALGRQRTIELAESLP
jgi:hypothetical protein